MRLLVLLSYISAVRSTLSNPFWEDSDTVNLFGDDDNNLNFDITADPNSITLDSTTNPIELTELNDFCKAPEEMSYRGRVRAREEVGKSCDDDAPDQNIQLFGFPSFFEILRDPPTKIEEEPPPMQPYFDPGVPPEEAHCRFPVPEHLCCESVALRSLFATIDGSELYNLMKGCSPGKYSIFD